MSLSTALSGLTAAQTDIATTSNNIANVGTTGFRGSRTEFADIYNVSPFSVSRTTTGSGTQVTRVAQDFTQGSIVATGNRLDLAIEGTGFFALAQPGVAGAAGQTVYSRAGAFGLSPTGSVINGSGQQLLGWPVSNAGQALNTALSTAQPITVPLSMGKPAATTTVTLAVNLPSDPTMAGQQDVVPPALAFDPNDATTYAHRTPVPVLDQGGNAVTAEAYFVRKANPEPASPDTIYEVHLFRDGTELPPDAGNQLVLDSTGKPTGATTLAFAGADGALQLDLADSRLTPAAFSVATVLQDGTTPSALTTLDIDAEGTIWATYASDTRQAVGKLLLVNFANPTGLRNLGSATYLETADSGVAKAGSPGAEGFGLLRSGALERSNVDLTEELVNLISSQRNYQASAKAMETSSAMMQTIMNLRN